MAHMAPPARHPVMKQTIGSAMTPVLFFIMGCRAGCAMWALVGHVALKPAEQLSICLAQPQLTYVMPSQEWTDISRL